MLSFWITDKSGVSKQIDNVLTVVWDCDMGVPADSLTITCPYSGDIRGNAVAMKVYEDEKLAFSGGVDTIVAVKQAKQVVLKLSCRSLAAGLLDNEAEPVTYNTPGASLIYEKHIKPFGIRLAEADNIPFYDKLRIGKGFSHWQVVQWFCRNRYNTEPRITGDGVAYLKGYHPKGESVFSDKGTGVSYYSLKETHRRYRLISEVKMKFRQANTYRSSVKNSNPEAAFVKSVRYVNAASEEKNIDTVDRMIANGNRNSYALNISCIGCHTGLVGTHAVIDDSVLGEISGLLVKSVRYSADRRGGVSAITLEKERFDVADELHNEKFNFSAVG